MVKLTILTCDFFLKTVIYPNFRTSSMGPPVVRRILERKAASDKGAGAQTFRNGVTEAQTELEKTGSAANTQRSSSRVLVSGTNMESGC